jgi:hypothetical protein
VVCVSIVVVSAIAHYALLRGAARSDNTILRLDAAADVLLLAAAAITTVNLIISSAIDGVRRLIRGGHQLESKG